jgi:hypothetical protein
LVDLLKRCFTKLKLVELEEIITHYYHSLHNITVRSNFFFLSSGCFLIHVMFPTFSVSWQWPGWMRFGALNLFESSVAEC